MTSKRVVLGLVIAHLMAAGASAEEFGRVSGGEIRLVPKAGSQFSGSLGLSASNQSERGYEGTLGGTLIDDRVWFFATARHQDRRVFTGFEQLELPQQAVSNMVGTKIVANLGDRQNLAASFDAGRQAVALTPGVVGPIVPSNFLSLRYSSAISSNMFFNATFSRYSNQDRTSLSRFGE